MKQYFKIGEISKLYKIGVDSIRYYEEIGLIQPERSESGYRHYSIHDIWRLNVIRDLRSIGFTMEQIREYLENHTTSSSLKLLEEEQEVIQQQMQYLQKLQKNVAQRLNTIRCAQTLPLYKIEQITCKRFPSILQLLLLTKKQLYSYCWILWTVSEGYHAAEEMDILIERLINLDKDRLYIIGSNQIGTRISLSALQDKKVLSYQSVFLIDEQGENFIPGGDYLCVTYRGSYSQSTQWGLKLAEYAKKHHLTVHGELLELLWVDIHISSDETEHITQLQLPVKKIS